VDSQAKGKVAEENLSMLIFGDNEFSQLCKKYFESKKFKVSHCKKNVYSLDTKTISRVFENEKPDIVLNFILMNNVLNFIKEAAMDSSLVAMQTAKDILEFSSKFKVNKVIMVSSTDVYPKLSEEYFDLIPFREESFWLGNTINGDFMYPSAVKNIFSFMRWYKDNKNLQSVMPLLSEIYGEGISNDLNIIPYLTNRILGAKRIEATVLKLSGDGEHSRNFLYTTDALDALDKIIFNMDTTNIINIGSEDDVSMNDIVEIIKKALDIDVQVLWKTVDSGVHQKLCVKIDRAINQIGWRPQVLFTDGISNWISSLEEKRTEKAIQEEVE